MCVYCTIMYALLQINASKVLLRSWRIWWTKHSLAYWLVDRILI